MQTLTDFRIRGWASSRYVRADAVVSRLLRRADVEDQKSASAGPSGRSGDVRDRLGLPVKRGQSGGRRDRSGPGGDDNNNNKV